MFDMPRTKNLQNYSDAHFTDREIASLIVDWCKPAGSCLEPALGDGAFLEVLPDGTEWCEITHGRDFFDVESCYDWIVTNPPFSNMTDWMRHSFDLASNVVFLIPLSKLFSSAPRMSLVREYGGIRKVLYLGSGRQIGFDIGFPFGAVHFEKDYTGPIDWAWG